mmetsp:Transcript_93149/g.184869  ORF Transcript_93149/g.184869 Transcript_93149/m.184869 type:complete len:189 (+) Transcript_93149:1055-1621(+)
MSSNTSWLKGSIAAKKPKDCGGASVAFHAYKTVESWFQCWGFARVAHSWTLPPAVGEVAASRSKTRTSSQQAARATLPSAPAEALPADSGRQAPEAATSVEGPASPVQLLPPTAKAVFPPDAAEPNSTAVPADNGVLRRKPPPDDSAGSISGMPQFHLPQFNFGRPPSFPATNITLLSGWPPQLGSLR